MSGKGTILLSLTDWDPEVWKAELKKAAPDRPVVLEPASADDPSIQYAIVWKQPSGILARLPNLKAIFSIGAGVDHIFNDDQIPDVPIVRTVSPDLTMRMSEYAVWQALDHHRRGPAYRDQQARHVWREDLTQPAACDVTVGIMGIGELGRDAAAKLLPLGFTVTGWSRTQKQVPGVECFAGDEGLGPFLAGADIVIVLLPLTPATQGILNMDMFRRMKKDGPLGGPVLVNAGRGALQVEADILKALDEGYLGAVSLDVFNTEPLPKDSPFWDHPRVTLTPHAAGSSSPPQLIPPMVRQMDNFEAGLPLENLVDRAAQY